MGRTASDNSLQVHSRDYVVIDVRISLLVVLMAPVRAEFFILWGFYVAFTFVCFISMRVRSV